MMLSATLLALALLIYALHRWLQATRRIAVKCNLCSDVIGYCSAAAPWNDICGECFDEQLRAIGRPPGVRFEHESEASYATYARIATKPPTITHTSTELPSPIADSRDGDA